MGVRKLTLHRLGLLAALPDLVLKVGDRFFDLVPVVAAKHHVELAWGRVFEEVTELGVDVGLHEAQSCCDETATGGWRCRIMAARILRVTGYCTRWTTSGDSSVLRTLPCWG